MGQEIFLLSTEAKDGMCLAPLAEGLRAEGAMVREMHLYDDLVEGRNSLCQRFVDADFPVAVFASIVALERLKRLRPEGS